MEKSKLEEEKLKLEIKELERNWFKKPQYLQVLLPTTLAIFSLLYAITSGLFSSKQELLELNKKRLETDIVAFEKEKQSLIYTNEDLKIKIGKYNDSLQDRNLILKKYEYSFTKERLKLEALNAEVTVLKNTKIDYNNQIAHLENEYKEKKKKYLDEIESKYYKEIDNDKKVKELEKTINELNTRIVDLKYNINLFESNPFVKTDKQIEYKIWCSNKMIEYYESKNVKNKSELERLENDLKKLEKLEDSLKVKQKINKIK